MASQPMVQSHHDGIVRVGPEIFLHEEAGVLIFVGVVGSKQVWLDL